MKLPVTIREKLFSFFLGGTLKRCRLVNKDWDKFIMDHMWGTMKGRQQLEANLEANWRKADPNAYSVVETYEDIDIRGVVEAMSSRFAAIRTYSNVNIDQARIKIYDVTGKCVSYQAHLMLTVVYGFIFGSFHPKYQVCALFRFNTQSRDHYLLGTF